MTNEEVIAKYPKIFREGFYIEHGDGWANILDAVFGSMNMWARYVDGVKITTLDFVQVVQIKEKFGGLRLYVNIAEGATPQQAGEIHGAIHVGEYLSAKTCERCGAPGTLHGDGWLSTLCPTHIEEYDKRKK
jgi:hypothetical protein